MTATYHYGTPSLDEWSGLWKSSQGVQDIEVADPQFEQFDETWSRLSSRLQGLNLEMANETDLYFRGDCFGDETQYLEVGDTEILTQELLGTIQAWLREPDFRTCRVLVQTYVGPGGAPMIYPDVIRFGVGFAPDLSTALRKIRRIQKLDTKFSFYSYVVNWDRWSRFRKRVPDSQDWRYHLRDATWANLHEPGDWIAVWGVAVAARNAITRIPTSHCDHWSSWLCAIHPPSLDSFDDLGEGLPILQLDPDEVIAIHTRLSSLDLGPVQRGWTSIGGTEPPYLSEFADFRDHVGTWTVLLERAMAERSGILLFAS